MNLQAAFFPHFSVHSLLGRFPRFDEASQATVETAPGPCISRQQDFPAPYHEHDDTGIDAGKKMVAALPADKRQFIIGGDRPGAAITTVPMRPDPVQVLIRLARSQQGLLGAKQEPAQFKLREPRDMRITGIKPKHSGRG
ncbi:MAG: hypothetical protein EBS81_12940 [Gammaproteobacteria bacterium]|nr:hypothetical protein [Gammaproteobacteria bacterium]